MSSGLAVLPAPVIPYIADQPRDIPDLIHAGRADLKLRRPMPCPVVAEFRSHSEDLSARHRRTAGPLRRCALQFTQKPHGSAVRDVPDRILAHIVVRDQIGGRLVPGQDMSDRIRLVSAVITALPAGAPGVEERPPSEDLLHHPEALFAVMHKLHLPGICLCPGRLHSPSFVTGVHKSAPDRYIRSLQLCRVNDLLSCSILLLRQHQPFPDRSRVKIVVLLQCRFSSFCRG